MDRLTHLRREVPLHAVMVGVMAFGMLSHSAAASVLGAGVLVTVSVPCAAFSRRHPFLRAQLLDLWAMAVVMLVACTTTSIAGSHHGDSAGLALPETFMCAIVIAAWAAARVSLARPPRREPSAPWGSVASGGVTAVGLLAMAVL